MLNTANERLNERVIDWVGSVKSYFGLSDTWAMLVLMLAILIIGLLLFYVLRPLLLGLAGRLAHREKAIWWRVFYRNHVFHRVSLLIPGIVTFVAAPLMTLSQFSFASAFARAIGIGAKMYIVCIAAAIIAALLTSIEVRFRHLQLSKKYSIKSYIQVSKILLYGITAIIVVSILIGKSPSYLLTGLGAMTAIVLLIFRDSILGFVASIQLSVYDMVRVGDWIELPKYGADGDIIDISLNTIKVQNFDKTIVTIPSYALLTDGVKNWRGMSEAGGRRIKRSINIDINSIKMCSDTLLERLASLPLLKKEIADLLADNQRYCDPQAAKLIYGNTHCISNLTVFRLYVEAFLSNHPKVHTQLSFMVRELQDQGKGVPLEIYTFSNTTEWVKYESIQADIFDYIYAILPLFELKAFQALSGSSLEFRLMDATSQRRPLQLNATH